MSRDEFYRQLMRERYGELADLMRERPKRSYPRPADPLDLLPSVTDAGDKQRWRVVAHCPLYAVSDQGYVARLPRPGLPTRPTILTPGETDNGYLHVVLHVEGARTNWYVHRLVAFAFCKLSPARKHVNHLDGDKQNNKASNLEWCTPQENLQHAYRTGLLKYKPILDLLKSNDTELKGAA